MVLKLLHCFQYTIVYFKGCGENQQATPEGENSMYYDIITLLDEVILPSLSFMDCNCCIAEEVWNIIKLYPYQCRLV
jgi:THO complex subunit 2